MAHRDLPDLVVLRQLLAYEPTTGIFTWKRRPLSMFATERAFSTWNARYADKIAGNVDPKGYRRIVVQYRLCWEHRLAWLYVHGTAPQKPLEIDHKDGNRQNNRIANLRVVTRSQNNFAMWRRRKRSFL
jgi:hypothetical protein